MILNDTIQSPALPGNKCAFSQANAADHIYSTPLERESATAKGQVVRLTFKPAPAEHVRSGSSSNTDTAHIRHPPLLCYSSYFKNIPCLLASIADPGCLSRILIFVHPGSRIPDPSSKTATKERSEKKFVVLPFFCSHKYHKTEN
jgi:hypothetical protein